MPALVTLCSLPLSPPTPMLVPAGAKAPLWLTPA
jgi:hypothetical protein